MLPFNSVKELACPTSSPPPSRLPALSPGSCVLRPDNKRRPDWLGVSMRLGPGEAPVIHTAELWEQDKPRSMGEGVKEHGRGGQGAWVRGGG